MCSYSTRLAEVTITMGQQVSVKLLRDSLWPESSREEVQSLLFIVSNMIILENAMVLSYGRTKSTNDIFRLQHLACHTYKRTLLNIGRYIPGT